VLSSRLERYQLAGGSSAGVTAPDWLRKHRIRCKQNTPVAAPVMAHAPSRAARELLHGLTAAQFCARTMRADHRMLSRCVRVAPRFTLQSSSAVRGRATCRACRGVMQGRGPLKSPSIHPCIIRAAAACASLSLPDPGTDAELHQQELLAGPPLNPASPPCAQG
jgi:hypothetical protein